MFFRSNRHDPVLVIAPDLHMLLLVGNTTVRFMLSDLLNVFSFSDKIGQMFLYKQYAFVQAEVKQRKFHWKGDI